MDPLVDGITVSAHNLLGQTSTAVCEILRILIFPLFCGLQFGKIELVRAHIPKPFSQCCFKTFPYYIRRVEV